MTTPQATEEPIAAKRYHHGDLRRALLDAADIVLERCGANGMSLRAVAREAGVSPAAPYHHFKDKDELISAIAVEGFLRLKAAMMLADQETAPGTSKAVTLGLAYIDFAQNHPSLYRAMYDSARREAAFPQDFLHEEGGFDLIKRALVEARGPGVSDNDIQMATIAAWCAVHGLAEMRGFAQFGPLKDRVGGEEAFLRGVLEYTAPVSNLAGSQP